MAARRMTDGSAGAFHRPSDLSTYPALQLAGSKILDVEETAVNPDPPEHRRGPLWILRKDCLARVLERRHITGIPQLNYTSMHRGCLLTSSRDSIFPVPLARDCSFI